MTALALYVGGDGIAMASDGVCYEYDTGLVAGYFSKVNLYPSRNALIACSGRGDMGAALNWEINQSHPCFDDLVDTFEVLCWRVHQKLTGGSTSPKDDVCVVLAGYSDERSQFEAYRVVSYPKTTITNADGTVETLKPWRLLPIENGWSSVSLPEDIRQRFGLTRFDHQPMDWCVRVVCAARANSGLITEDDGSTRHFLAGGFCQVALLERNAISTFITHRWPDPVGEPIDPSTGEPMPAYLVEIDNEQI